ncbi:Dynein intermediate chain 2, ciliary [Gryllus bimaculatus]|nr:Dynein intermediate chain 2, ciliary [Gryllus bimaculatus]
MSDEHDTAKLQDDGDRLPSAGSAVLNTSDGNTDVSATHGTTASKRSVLGSKTLKTKASLMKNQVRPEAFETVSADEVDPSFKLKTIGKLDEQLVLTPMELKEEVSRTLTDKNPKQPDNLVEYSQKDSCFVGVGPTTYAAVLYELQDTESESKEEIAAQESEEKDAAADEEGAGEENAVDGEDEEKEEDVGRKDSSADAPRAGGAKKITNQFNFCERAAMTFNNKKRIIATQTMPPPRAVFSKQICQYTIYDGYQEDFQNQKREKEKEKERKEKGQQQQTHTTAPTKKKICKKNNNLSETSKRMAAAVRTLERMVNQNIFDDIAQVDFMKSPPQGAVCLYTLKNPSHPEYVFTTDAPVMCVDIHPAHPHLFVVGRWDGNVAVYNVRLHSNQPQYRSNSVRHKHESIVWQVKWGCGTAITFHPNEPLTFLVGTEEGYIHKCSTAYTSMYLMTYQAHHMPIHRIDYNKFNPNIFISCSADWRIKMWEDNRMIPLFVFDVGSPIGDIEWSPYSSTVFACVTNDGKVHVFDININKYKPICSQSVVSKKRNKLTRLSFNFKLPIIIVGDDRGSLITLKMSPNLRKKMKPPKKGPPIDPWVLEARKLEKLLALVREPGQQVELSVSARE